MSVQSGLPSRLLPVEQYVAALASSAPTPGGGSAAATTGALAAALTEMVCNLTLDGRHAPQDATALRRASQRTAELRSALLDLATEDERAFAAYRAAADMPRTTADERAVRQAALQRALVGAADVPLRTAETALGVLELLIGAAREGSAHVLTDASTAAQLARAAVLGATYNVRVNADSIKDRDLAASLHADANAFVNRADTACDTVLSIVRERTA